MMTNRSMERGLAGNLPGEVIHGRIKSGGHFDAATLGLSRQGLQREHALHGGGAVPMYIANRGADLSITVSLKIFHQEVDQTALALKRSQQRQGFAACCGGLFRFRAPLTRGASRYLRTVTDVLDWLPAASRATAISRWLPTLALRAFQL